MELSSYNIVYSSWKPSQMAEETSHATPIYIDCISLQVQSVFLDHMHTSPHSSRASYPIILALSTSPCVITVQLSIEIRQYNLKKGFTSAVSFYCILDIFSMFVGYTRNISNLKKLFQNKFIS